MTDDQIAQGTCEKFLTAPQLKEVCRYRGFSAPPTIKQDLAAYVAARFNGTEGVTDAARSLDETHLVVLHAIAMADRPARLWDLLHIVHPDRHYDDASRGDFNRLAANLLNRGLVLVQDDVVYASAAESRYARVGFSVPADHRPFFPPFPVATDSLGPDCGRTDPALFARDALLLALRGPTPSGTDGYRRLLSRVTSLFTLEGGTLLVGGAEPTTVSNLMARARRVWTELPKRNQYEYQRQPLMAADYVLSHLPPGDGCTVDALAQALRLLGEKVGRDVLEAFVNDGWRAGFLVRGGPESCPRYAISLALTPDETGPAADRPHASDRDAIVPAATPVTAFSPKRNGIVLDPERSDPDAVLELTRFSRAAVNGGQLELVPDRVRMGRQADRLEASPALVKVREESRIFDEAVREVLGRHGQVMLHEGLALFRVADVGLRALLLHQFPGKMRLLAGPYLAAPRVLRDEIETFTRRQGFVPRKVS